MSSLVILGNAELQDLLAFLESPKPYLPTRLASVPAKLRAALKFIPQAASEVPPSPPSQSPSQDIDMEISLCHMESNSHPLVSSNNFDFFIAIY